MKKFVTFDVIDSEINPSLEDLCNKEIEDNFSPNNPKFLGWEEKAIEWARFHVGDYKFFIELVGPHDTYVSLSYDDGTVYIPSSLDDNMDF